MAMATAMLMLVLVLVLVGSTEAQAAVLLKSFVEDHCAPVPQLLKIHPHLLSLTLLRFVHSYPEKGVGRWLDQGGQPRGAGLRFVDQGNAPTLLHQESLDDDTLRSEELKHHIVPQQK